MNNRLALILLLVFGVIIGFMVGINLQSGGGGFGKAPANHESVISTVTIRDTTFNQYLTPVYVGSGQTVPLSVVPLSFVGKIEYSKWEFRSIKDDASTALAYAMVWGPGNQNEYFCELGRLSTNAYDLKTPAGENTWKQGSNEGFVYFFVTR